ncbi:MAG: hypothetical protein QOJ65_347 [Fimbriimonadaceae bacterium]|jgi:diacylglycerol kinase (ATP)|nr:hypothetical protein [Fimbriimonadaceae bacterium]
MAEQTTSAKEKVQGSSAATRAMPLLVNAKAGKLHRHASPDKLRKLCEELGLDVRVVETTSPEHVREVIKGLRDAGEPRLALAGGDGTIHHAVQQIAHSEMAVGIIPQGTANNFATALGIPMELPDAIQALRKGVPHAVDLGFVAGEYFTESAGVGLFSDALAIHGKADKNPFHALRAVLFVAFSMRSRRIKLIVDGKVLEERAVMCTAANTNRIGLRIPVAPDAKVDDRVFDLVILGDLHRHELLRYWRAIRAERHTELPKVKVLCGRRIEIESPHRSIVHCDDHVVGRTPACIELHPGALQVLLDPDRPVSGPKA